MGRGVLNRRFIQKPAFVLPHDKNHDIEMPKVGVVNRMRMRIVHDRVNSFPLYTSGGQL